VKENHIIINKTARFFTLGELNAKTTQVWIVLHGWGYDVKEFLSPFESLLNEDTFIIAPEALNRFYLKGSGGKVGATWMTKEDRLNEIKDYIHYLNDIYKNFELDRFSGDINVLGFSQGASTATRWINATEHRVDLLIVYAGEVAPELFPLQSTSGLKKTKNIFIYGTQDEYFTPELLSQMKNQYREMNFTEIEFDGKHIIKPEVLKPFFKQSN
jgi:predicted esterase